MEKFENLDNEQKQLVEYWIRKYQEADVMPFINEAFIKKHLTPNPIIEAGFWYRFPHEEKWMLYVEKSNHETFSGYGFDACGKWMSDWKMLDLMNLKGLVKVTPKEVESRLIAEAKRRDLDKDLERLESFYFENNELHAKYGRIQHTLVSKCILKNGEWADVSEHKVITCTVSTSAGSITSTDPKTLTDILFGSEGNINCRETIEGLFGHLKPHEREVYIFTFEKRFTQKELDGDIH